MGYFSFIFFAAGDPAFPPSEMFLSHDFGVLVLLFFEPDFIPHYHDAGRVFPRRRFLKGGSCPSSLPSHMMRALPLPKSRSLIFQEVWLSLRTPES